MRLCLCFCLFSIHLGLDLEKEWVGGEEFYHILKRTLREKKPQEINLLKQPLAFYFNYFSYTMKNILMCFCLPKPPPLFWLLKNGRQRLRVYFTSLSRLRKSHMRNGADCIQRQNPLWGWLRMHLAASHRKPNRSWLKPQHESLLTLPLVWRAPFQDQFRIVRTSGWQLWW